MKSLNVTYFVKMLIEKIKIETSILCWTALCYDILSIFDRIMCALYSSIQHRSGVSKDV